VNAELDIMCPRCRHAIPRGRGCLWVSYAEIRGGIRESGGQTAEGPDEITWKVHHDGCTAEPGDAYSIEVVQISTWAGLSRWTAHLMAKTWFPLSDWDELLREAAGESTQSPRIVSRVRNAA
jgi:hypothetical protein